MLQHGIAEYLIVVLAILLCLGTGLAFLLAAGCPADVMKRTVCTIQTVTLIGFDDSGVVMNLPGNGRRGFVETVCNVAKRVAFMQESRDPGTVISCQMLFALHKDVPSLLRKKIVTILMINDAGMTGSVELEVWRGKNDGNDLSE